MNIIIITENICCSMVCYIDEDSKIEASDTLKLFCSSYKSRYRDVYIIVIQGCIQRV